MDYRHKQRKGLGSINLTLASKKLNDIVLGRSLYQRINHLDFINVNGLMAYMSSIPTHSQNAIHYVSLALASGDNAELALDHLSKCQGLMQVTIDIADFPQCFPYAKRIQIPGMETFIHQTPILQKFRIQYDKDLLATALTRRRREITTRAMKAVEKEILKYEVGIRKRIIPPYLKTRGELRSLFTESQSDFESTNAQVGTEDDTNPNSVNGQQFNGAGIVITTTVLVNPHDNPDLWKFETSEEEWDTYSPPQAPQE